MTTTIIKYEINFDDTWNLYDADGQLLAKGYSFRMVELYIGGLEGQIEMVKI